MQERAWTTKEAAQYLNISVPRLAEKARLNQVPCVKFGGKWLFNKEALAEFVSGHYHFARGGGLRIVENTGAKKQCQSTKEKTQATSGTSTLDDQTAFEYDNLVKRPTAKTRKNCTTPLKRKHGVSKN